MAFNFNHGRQKQGWFQREKSWGPCPRRKGITKAPRSEDSRKYFGHALSVHRKCHFAVQRMATYTRKGCKSERAKITESRENDREIRVQDDSITENTNTRSPFIFRKSHTLLLTCKARRQCCDVATLLLCIGPVCSSQVIYALAKYVCDS